MVYDVDFLNGGTATASSEFNATLSADQAFDNNESTRWQSSGTYPEWIKYDLGAGVAKKARKLRIYSSAADMYTKNFVLAGSNNDSDWTTVYSGLGAESDGWQDFTFTNSGAYRYYRLTITDTYGGNGDVCNQNEIEMMEEKLAEAFLLNFI